MSIINNSKNQSTGGLYDLGIDYGLNKNIDFGSNNITQAGYAPESSYGTNSFTTDSFRNSINDSTTNSIARDTMPSLPSKKYGSLYDSLGPLETKSYGIGSNNNQEYTGKVSRSLTPSQNAYGNKHNLSYEQMLDVNDQAILADGISSSINKPTTGMSGMEMGQLAIGAGQLGLGLAGYLQDRKTAGVQRDLLREQLSEAKSERKRRDDVRNEMSLAFGG